VERGAKFAEVNYRVVRTLADTDVPAKWYEGDYFGNLFAPKASKASKPAGSNQPQLEIRPRTRRHRI
jgi:hypothetical protein